jgi:hypothetical protein
VYSTNKMPHSARRSSSRLRPDAGTGAPAWAAAARSVPTGCPRPPRACAAPRQPPARRAPIQQEANHIDGILLGALNQLLAIYPHLGVAMARSALAHEAGRGLSRAKGFALGRRSACHRGHRCRGRTGRSVRKRVQTSSASAPGHAAPAIPDGRVLGDYHHDSCAAVAAREVKAYEDTTGLIRPTASASEKTSF